MEKRILAKELYIRMLSFLLLTGLFTAYVLHCLFADVRFACNTALGVIMTVFACSQLNQSSTPRFSNAKGLDRLRRHRLFWFYSNIELSGWLKAHSKI